MGEKTRLRRAISKWANPSEQHARDMRAEYAGRTGTSIAEAPDRTPVVLRGSISSLTVRPRGGVPALEAELDDGSGTLVILWLGRRRIAGIDPGRSIQVEGRIGRQDGQRVLYNPRYELLS
jgi:hypothetical protein